MEERELTGRTDEELAAMNVEESFSAIDELIGSLENGEGSLEEAFRDYEEGIRLIKSCSEKIDRIEKQMIILQNGAEEDENAG